MNWKRGELIGAMKDMLAFIRWCERHQVRENISPTLQHDLHGIIEDEECFQPRSWGYQFKLMEEIKQQRMSRDETKPKTD